MPLRKFRKLNIELPLQSTVNERPWLVAGLLLAFAILLIAGYSYIKYKGTF